MEEDNLIPLSYISQYVYCKRRVGLLMLEQQWKDSTDTVKGTLEHHHVHVDGIKTQNGIFVLTDMTVVSKKLNLFGKCDAVEASACPTGTAFPFLPEGLYALYPIEYKHGKLRSEHEYELQLCAQAMCLEEMYHCTIPSGALFYISSHRRKEIIFTTALRNDVIDTAKALHKMMISGKTSTADFSSKCIRCSLKDICMPEVNTSAQSYLEQIKKEMKGVS